jgi:hypothetical protein
MSVLLLLSDGELSLPIFDTLKDVLHPRWGIQLHFHSGQFLQSDPTHGACTIKHFVPAIIPYRSKLECFVTFTLLCLMEA